MRECPTCGLRIPADSRVCVQCRPMPSPPRVAGKTRALAWEVWVAMGALAVSLGNNLLAVRIPAVVVGALMILGLVFRTTWALWWTVIAALLGSVMSFFSFEGNPLAIAVAVGSNLLLVGLLISCKIRDAY